MSSYKLLPQTEQDLEQIWHYTVNQWGIEQANSYIDDFAQAFTLLAETPLICRERAELSPPVRIYRKNHHLNVYTLQNNIVLIIRILHKNMDVEDQL